MSVNTGVSPIKLDFTSDSAGAATVQYDVTDPVLGLVYGVQLINGTCDTTVDVTVTIEQGDLSIPVLVLTDQDADVMKYPRALECLNTDGSALTTSTIPLACGRPKIVVAGAGDVKTGAVILYIV